MWHHIFGLCLSKREIEKEEKKSQITRQSTIDISKCSVTERVFFIIFRSSIKRRYYSLHHLFPTLIQSTIVIEICI